MSISDAPARNAVSDDIEQMDAIISQFLDYARDERQERLESTDVNALVAEAAGAQGRAAHDVRLTLGELPPVPLHRLALARALANLLDNARKYGGGEVAIVTRCEHEQIVIDVQDRGPGIAAGEIERLKRPFTRLENARSDATGTGLGLAIVERIARLHEGSLELLARDGGGLIARLRLPIKRQP